MQPPCWRQAVAAIRQRKKIWNARPISTSAPKPHRRATALPPARFSNGRDGGYLVCDAAAEGSYKRVEPFAEISALDAADQQFNGNVRKLTRILKQWQRQCDVPIKSFHLEAVVKGILPLRFYGGSDEFWFGWLVRDALGHLISCANGWFFMPRTGEQIFLGNAWLSKAQTAYQRALKACDYERDNCEFLAGDEWQKLFGTMIPLTVS